MSKETKEITTFSCDGPGCKKSIESEEGYPYEKGWIYLYQFSGKTGDNSSDEMYKTIDGHFCSKKCFFKFLETFFDKHLKQGGKDGKSKNAE